MVIIDVVQSVDFWLGLTFALAAEELARSALRARTGGIVETRTDVDEDSESDDEDSDVDESDLS